MTDLALDELVGDLLSGLPDDMVSTVTFEDPAVTPGSGLSVSLSSTSYTVDCSMPAPVMLEQAGSTAVERGDLTIVVANLGDVALTPPQTGWTATVAADGKAREVMAVNKLGLAAYEVQMKG